MQPEKAPSPMELMTLVAKTDRREVHPENAPLPTEVTVMSKETLISCVQPLKAPEGRCSAVTAIAVAVPHSLQELQLIADTGEIQILNKQNHTRKIDFALLIVLPVHCRSALVRNERSFDE